MFPCAQFSVADKTKYFYRLRVITEIIHRDYIYALKFWWSSRAIVYLEYTISRDVFTGNCGADVEGAFFTYDDVVTFGKNKENKDPGLLVCRRGEALLLTVPSL